MRRWYRIHEYVRRFYGAAQPSKLIERDGFAIAQPILRFRDIPQPIERALQDEDRGVLVDHGLASVAACSGGNQLALDRRGGEPLIPERNWQLGEPREVARKRARRLRARTFAAVHVDGQAEHEGDRLALGRERKEPPGIGG